VVPQVEKNSKLKLIPVQHHFLIISCSYALNPAPSGFAIINPAPAGFAKTKSGTALFYLHSESHGDTKASLVSMVDVVLC